MENNMITANGLEKRLRKMRVWTRFQNNLAKDDPTKISLCSLSVSYFDEVLSTFFFDETPEGRDYWWNIANKIDKVKL